MNKGSRVTRFLRATVFGALAGALGTSLYFGILATTEYEFALIAIVVGLLVGFAVRAGARGRGGWAYQGLAMLLTYSAIVASYAPLIYSEIVKQMPADTARSLESAPAALQTVSVVILYLVALAVSYVAPILAASENLLGLVIIAIGLYQAWKINKAPQIGGPYAVRQQKAKGQ